MSKPVDVDQQSHMITHLTRISAPVHTRDTVETGTVLPGFGKLKPIPAPVHTRDTLSRVYPYPCHALTKHFRMIILAAVMHQPLKELLLPIMHIMVCCSLAGQHIWGTVLFCTILHAPLLYLLQAAFRRLILLVTRYTSSSSIKPVCNQESMIHFPDIPHFLPLFTLQKWMMLIWTRFCLSSLFLMLHDMHAHLIVQLF